MNKCECGKEIKDKSKRCYSCNTKHRHLLGSLNNKGINNANYKDGRSLKKYYCTDCNREINWQNKSGKCNSCCKKGNQNSLIDGRTYKNYYCIKCGNKICLPTAIYGSRLCNSCANKKNIGKGNPSYKDGRTLNKDKCVICNKEVKEYRCKTCSRECRRIYIINNKIAKGINNSNWQGGIGKLPYAFEFNEELKEQIRKRDNYTCQNCGMTEEEHLIVIGRVLIVHHIDYDKTNCKEDNLITTCNSCNIRANYNREQWKEYYQNKLEIKNVINK